MSDERETQVCPKCGAKLIGEPFVAKTYVSLYWKCYSKSINGVVAQSTECRVRELTAANAALAARVAQLEAVADAAKRLVYWETPLNHITAGQEYTQYWHDLVFALAAIPSPESTHAQ